MDITIDFSSAFEIGHGAILSIITHLDYYKKDYGIDCHLILPTNEKLKRLFVNANWAHFIDPSRHDFVDSSGPGNVPILPFLTGIEQGEVVDRAIRALLGVLPSASRKSLATVEWAINEVTDNVIVHSESTSGGKLLVASYPKRKHVRLIVSDAGIGIPRSFGHHQFTSDVEALDFCIREGATRDKNVGQGNGLYGAWRIATASRGLFSINSGKACLVSTPKIRRGGSTLVHSMRERVPFHGTIVSITIDYSDDSALSDALDFGGRDFEPYDFIEKFYETEQDGLFFFKVAEEERSFGSRYHGKNIRKKILHLLNIDSDKLIIIDVSGINVMSSSFADEAFAKIIIDLSPAFFQERIRFSGGTVLIDQLISRSVRQRLESISETQ